MDYTPPLAPARGWTPQQIAEGRAGAEDRGLMNGVIPAAARARSSADLLPSSPNFSQPVHPALRGDTSSYARGFKGLRSQIG